MLLPFLFSFLALVSPVGRVNDLAKVLNSSQTISLEQRLVDYEKNTSNEIAILIVKSLNGENIDDYGIKVFEQWKIGKKGKDNGILIIVAVDDRKTRIDVGYGLEAKVNDARTGDIIRNVMAPEFRKGDYYAGIDKAVDALTNYIGGEDAPAVTLETKSSFDLFWIPIFIFIYTASFMARSKSWWLGGVIGGLLGLIWGLWGIIVLGSIGLFLDWLLSRNYEKLKLTGMSTGFWSSAGGFKSSGGGFGGFSGGRSGGGGSSGSW
jgi:uncharacterized protein